MSSDLRERLLQWLDASPSELAGLGVLLTGSVLALLLLTRAAAPTAAPTAAAGIEEAPTGGPVATAVTVHVVGEVVAPGVVALGLGARVRDAIAAAGGPTSAARLDAVNLARPVHDGEQLVVPGPDAAVGTSAAGAEDGVIDADGRVDLNRATAADLETLPGIGPVLAQRIVDHRDANGPFTSPGDLRQVSGIGERTFQSLVELVVVR